MDRKCKGRGVWEWGGRLSVSCVAAGRTAECAVAAHEDGAGDRRVAVCTDSRAARSVRTGIDLKHGLVDGWVCRDHARRQRVAFELVQSDDARALGQLVRGRCALFAAAAPPRRFALVWPATTAWEELCRREEVEPAALVGLFLQHHDPKVIRRTRPNLLLQSPQVHELVLSQRQSRMSSSGLLPVRAGSKLRKHKRSAAAGVLALVFAKVPTALVCWYV